jgi:hypothetical protein
MPQHPPGKLLDFSTICVTIVVTFSHQEKKMEVRLNIDDAFLKNMQEKLGGNVKATDITRDALTIFNWAVEEAAKGRAGLSVNKASGEDVHRLIMPSLSQIQAK